VRAVVLSLAILLGGCGLFGGPGADEPKECEPGALAQIEAEYLAEATFACQGYGYEDCERLPEIRAKYQAKRKEWVSCE
jgi:hypothetical protein